MMTMTNLPSPISRSVVQMYLWWEREQDEKKMQQKRISEGAEMAYLCHGRVFTNL
jgi:hypothetical protein